MPAANSVAGCDARRHGDQWTLVGDAIASHGRHLHFRRKPLVESALRRWTGARNQRDLTDFKTRFSRRDANPASKTYQRSHLASQITVQGATRPGR